MWERPSACWIGILPRLAWRDACPASWAPLPQPSYFTELFWDTTLVGFEINAKGTNMKRYLFIILLITLFFTGICQAKTVPHQVGGFVLEEDISSYKDKLDMASDLPIRHMECIRELEVMGIEGFKSGLIAYGTCDAPGKIVRIKLKYKEGGKKRYEQLLKRFKKQFGAPDEWRGDPFGIVLAWKWSFTDSRNNRISLTLQHNTKDVEEKIGNSVKLTLTSQLEKEKVCWRKKNPEEISSHKSSEPGGKKQKDVNWNQLIPH
jgi:hypothetical protein